MTFLPETFLEASKSVQVLGGFAVIAGAIGPIVAWLFSRLVSDHRRLRRALRDRDVLAATDCTGPFSRPFRPYLEEGAGQLPFQPSDIVNSIRAALAESFQGAVEPLRIWTQLPLLLGLVSTAWNLRSLLRQQIGPATMPGLTRDMSNALLGTILGISGALVATLLQRVVIRHARIVRTLADRYLFDVFSRTLPEVRVKLQYDDQMLDMLAAKAQGAVDQYQRALDPLVTTLASAAHDAANAAGRAHDALSSVASAVKDVEALNRVASELTKAVALSVRAGEVLEAQVPLIADQVTLSRNALNVTLEMAGSIRTSMSSLETATKGMTTSASTLGAAVQSERSSIADATSRLSTQLDELNNQSRAAIGHVQDLGREVGTLREAINTFGDARVGQVTDDLRQKVDRMLDVLKTGLDTIPGSLAQNMARLGTSTADVHQKIRDARGAVDDVEAGLRRLSEAAVVVGSALPMVTVSGPTTAPPADLIDALQQFESLPVKVAALAAIEHEILTTLQERLPQPQRRRGPGLFRRLGRGLGLQSEQR